MTPTEKACKGVVRRYAKIGPAKCAHQINGIWRCTAKREPYTDKDVARHRLPTCEDIDVCKYRPAPEKEKNEDDQGEVDTDKICKAQESPEQD